MNKETINSIGISHLLKLGYNIYLPLHNDERYIITINDNCYSIQLTSVYLNNTKKQSPISHVPISQTHYNKIPHYIYIIDTYNNRFHLIPYIDIEGLKTISLKDRYDCYLLVDRDIYDKKPNKNLQECTIDFLNRIKEEEKNRKEKENGTEI